MGRKNKYFLNVKPNLDKIPEWFDTMSEYQIARKLDIAPSTFELYKTKYPELREALGKAKKFLCDELKDIMRKKARGYYYTEIKETYLEIETEKGDRVKTGEIKVEKTRKYAVPDTGAIHLLLKNFDDDWRNDDKATMDLKREKLKFEKQRAEESW